MMLHESLGRHARGSPILRVLLIHDDVDDQALIRETVEGDDGAIVCDVAGSYQAGEAAILDGNYDACLVDHRLGARSGIDLMGELGHRAQGPLILLTSDGGYEIEEEALASGAADCFEKSQLTTDGMPQVYPLCDPDVERTLQVSVVVRWCSRGIVPLQS